MRSSVSSAESGSTFCSAWIFESVRSWSRGFHQFEGIPINRTYAFNAARYHGNSLAAYSPPSIVQRLTILHRFTDPQRHFSGYNTVVHSSLATHCWLMTICC
ncbi:unnamed protein product [Ceratitis capitata]|uniref:(Mediterranean fruit fly) hypothetical protein n=1 Tax=Ceratitis capitata TaxID=7213 RepID=A0A811VFU0_CERCA|nr:unnamed protein product [Ceratitis capitata]